MLMGEFVLEEDGHRIVRCQTSFDLLPLLGILDLHARPPEPAEARRLGQARHGGDKPAAGEIGLVRAVRGPLDRERQAVRDEDEVASARGRFTGGHFG